VAEVCLHEFRDMPKVVALCLDATLTRLLPRVLASIGRGERVEFGAIGASSFGLDHRGQTAVWQELALPQIRHGGLEIQRRRSRERYIDVSVSDTPNFHLLVGVCHTFIKA
jgi:hypothetical protein